MERRCDKCAAYKVRIPENLPFPSSGECRATAPINGMWGRWAYVDGNDWCLEFMSKEKECKPTDSE